ncbi:MAG: LPS biosynthesis protein WbpP, partial [Mycobacterium sp.]|nr:LPS biosynthesis protein WbpP [Mycobacterium sp.]
NVADGARISLNQAWATLETILGPLPTPHHATSRAGDIRHSRADISKAERLLGYRPIVSFEEGLRRTVDWARGRS